MYEAISMYLRKIYLIIITLNLTKSQRNIGIYIIKLFKKTYTQYNQVYIKLGWIFLYKYC